MRSRLRRLKSLHTNENVLMAVDGFYRSKLTFLTTFLMTYMMRMSLDSSPIEFINYRILSFVGMAILAIVLLHFIKKHTLLAWRLGMIFAVIQIIVIIIFNQQTDLLPYLLAITTAVESTLYMRPSAFFVISEVRNDRRLRFQSIRQVITDIVKIIMPLILGLTISESGYVAAAFIVLVITIVQALLSILFRPSRDLTFPTHRPDVTVRQITSHPSIRRILYLQFFRGIIGSGSAFLIIPTLLLYDHTGSDFDLGLYASLGAAIAIVIIFIFHQLFRKNRRGSKAIVSLLAALTVVASLALLLFPSQLTAIILYVYAIAIIESFFNMFLVTRIQRSIKKHLNGHSFTIEIESISEVFLCAGRVASLSALLLTICASGLTLLPLFVTINAILIVPVVILSRSKKKLPIDGEPATSS